MQNLIDMSKQYKTKSGIPVRVLCVDRKHECYTVVALVENDVHSYTKEGYFDSESYPDEFDLVEVSPYDDFKVGDYVMVRDYDQEAWNPRVFAGVESGTVFAYPFDYNPWSNNDTGEVGWNYCRKPTKEELEERGITK